MDIYPTKAQFLRGEEASLRLETCGAAVLKVVIRLSRLGAVSYTHLDVYKRQILKLG